MSASPIKDLGPCEVSWNSVVIGPTAGTTKVTIETQSEDVKEEGQGNIAVDAVFTGTKIEVQVPLTRTTLAVLEDVLANSTLGGSQLDIANAVGWAMYPLAQELVVKPLVNNVASVTDTEWITFYKTYPTAKFEIGYDNKGQRIFQVNFKVFPSDESGQVGDFGKIGD